MTQTLPFTNNFAIRFASNLSYYHNFLPSQTSRERGLRGLAALDGFRGAALLILAVELRELRAHPLHALP